MKEVAIQVSNVSKLYKLYDKPIIFEVFTNSDEESQALKKVRNLKVSIKGATKDIISGSKTFDVVNNINNADFVIEPSAEWYVGPNNATPAIQYKLSLTDSKGKKIDEWIEIIRQVKE